MADSPSAVKLSPTPKPRGRMSWRKRWLIRGVVIVVGLTILKIVTLDSKFYYPSDETYLTPEEVRLAYEDVTFTTPDGERLHGWWLPAEGKPRGIVVHFHGNAANVTGHLALVDWLPRAGYDVLMFDYRGYGKSTGRVTRAGTIIDGHAALDYAFARPEARTLPVFVYGQSIGGAIALYVAQDYPQIRAIVAESTFGNYRKIAALHARKLVRANVLCDLVVWLGISSGYDPLDVLAKRPPSPLFVITAANDQICPAELGEEVYRVARGPKEYWCVPDAEHLEITSVAGQELSTRITDFFTRAVAETPAPASTTRPATPPLDTGAP